MTSPLTGTNVLATTSPTTRRSVWAMVLVVLAMITDGTLAS
jgi:hypothetical protein